MKIDEYLSQRLTNDKHAEVIEENYRGLMEVEGVDRDPFQEMYIKLNRYERRDTPMKAIEIQGFMGDFTLSCPSCNKPIVNCFSSRKFEPKFCIYCGQALDWSEVE